jgi:DNA-binding transcriptional LysR family regulator
MFKGTLILVKGEIVNKEEINNYLEQNFITVQNVITVNSTAALIELTKQGMGIGFVAKEFISQEIRNKELLVVLSNFKKVPLSTGLIRKQQTLCNPIANKFWEMIKTANKEKSA